MPLGILPCNHFKRNRPGQVQHATINVHASLIISRKFRESSASTQINSVQITVSKLIYPNFFPPFDISSGRISRFLALSPTRFSLLSLLPRWYSSADGIRYRREHPSPSPVEHSTCHNIGCNYLNLLYELSADARFNMAARSLGHIQADMLTDTEKHETLFVIRTGKWHSSSF